MESGHKLTVTTAGGPEELAGSIAALEVGVSVHEPQKGSQEPLTLLEGLGLWRTVKVDGEEGVVEVGAHLFAAVGGVDSQKQNRRQHVVESETWVGIRTTMQTVLDKAREDSNEAPRQGSDIGHPGEQGLSVLVRRR
jgi:hypothetical protein